MKKLTKLLRFRGLVKESVDNLPSGIAVFSEKGLVVLCNYQMSRLIFAMTGQDLQSIEELKEILKMVNTSRGAVRDGFCFLLPDGSTWKFSLNRIANQYGTHYTEAIAVDVTDLREKQRQLVEANEAKKQTIATIEQIQQNVVSITREEEILALKMKLHNEFGYNLQLIRKFFQHGCPDEEKEEFLTRQKSILQKMQGELDNNDEVDSMTELEQLAKTLDMQIIITGEKPKQANVRELLSYAVRECLINTVRHAECDRMYVEFSYSDNELTATLTNTGIQPKTKITEGGGLTSLRTRIENAGGTMTVHIIPQFALIITIPVKGDIL